MMVNFSVLITPEGVNDSVEDDLNREKALRDEEEENLSHLKEWNHEVEDKPNIHHLYVRCLWQIL